MSQIDNRQIRVFISSTFQDMQGERTYLMKHTFPKLRQIAASRDVMLTELDLRWGITEEESKSGKVVDICLREIENSVPFFIGIIGNRYGWVPQKSDIGEQVTERFPSVNHYLDRHLSVTEMEMQFGVLEREEDMNAFFFIKEEEQQADNPKMLKQLKEAVKASRYPSSLYSSIEDLAQQVERAFLSLLDSLFPEGVTEHQKEKLIQKSFISKLSATYVKDEDNFKRLNTFAAEPSAPCLVVTGESGVGKSSLMANWAKQDHRSDGFSVIPYFSSNGGNQTHTHILKYLIEEFRERFDIAPTQGPETDQLEKIFDVIAIKKERLVIVFDAINQIADVDNAKMLNWLPLPPDNVKYIFSTLEDDATMQVFKNRHYPVFYLHTLNDSQKVQLIDNYLHSYGKKLQASQKERIIKDPQCANTLVLKTLLDELIGYGDYLTLDRQIDYYLHCESVTAFYEKVLARFEQDFGFDFVRLVLSLIAVSRNGMPEEELIQISGAKRLEWSDFFGAFSTHLNNQSGRYVFTHNFITHTVWQRYLVHDKSFERQCRILVFQEMAKIENENSMQEVPYQLDKLNMWDQLHEYITTCNYLNFCIPYDEVEIGTYWRHILAGAPGKYSVEDYLKQPHRPEDTITVYSNLLRLCQVLYLTRPQKHVVKLLLAYLKDHPELVTAQVYRTLSSNTSRPDSLKYANMSLDICREQHNIPGEIESLRLLGSAYYDAAVKENDDSYGTKAYEAWEKAKNLSEDLYGNLHPLVMHGYKDMCLVCGDNDRALELAHKALDLSISIYGADHPLTGRPYHYVGVIYRELKKWPEALHYFREAYRVWLPAYGRNHEIMNSSFGNQGKALMNLGRLEEALQCYDTCLEIQDIILEERGYEYAVCQMNRARILSGLGRKEEAIQACDEIITTLNKEEVKAEGRSKPLMESCLAFRKTIS